MIFISSCYYQMATNNGLDDENPKHRICRPRLLFRKIQNYSKVVVGNNGQ